MGLIGMELIGNKVAKGRVCKGLGDKGSDIKNSCWYGNGTAQGKIAETRIKSAKNTPGHSQDPSSKV